MQIVDTAPQYGFGLSEILVGKAVREFGHREQVFIATKVGLEWDHQHRVWRNSGRERIMKEVQDSLSRLQTDYLDLYQVHWPDPDTPMAETADTLRELYERGIIRAIGVSNFSPQQIEEWMTVAPLHAHQLSFNLFQREQEQTLIFCKQRGIVCLAWGVLAHGLLTGKFTTESTFDDADHRQKRAMFQAPHFSQYVAAVNQLQRLAAERGKTVQELAMRWALQKTGVSIALWGARRPEQLKTATDIGSWQLREDEVEQIERIVRETVKQPAPPKSNPGPPSRSVLFRED